MILLHPLCTLLILSFISIAENGTNPIPKDKPSGKLCEHNYIIAISSVISS